MRTKAIIRHSLFAMPALLLTVAFLWAIGSGRASHALARSEGYVLLIEDPAREFTARPGEVVTASFLVTNLLDESVRILGVRTGCSCTSAEPVPVTIQPGGNTSLTFQFDMHNWKPGSNYELAPLLYLDHPGPPTPMSVRIRVVDSPKE